MTTSGGLACHLGALISKGLQNYLPTNLQQSFSNGSMLCSAFSCSILIYLEVFLSLNRLHVLLCILLVCKLPKDDYWYYSRTLQYLLVNHLNVSFNLLKVVVSHWEGAVALIGSVISRFDAMSSTPNFVETTVAATNCILRIQLHHPGLEGQISLIMFLFVRLS